jgi:hypothetical protein
MKRAAISAQKSSRINTNYSKVNSYSPFKKGSKFEEKVINMTACKVADKGRCLFIYFHYLKFLNLHIAPFTYKTSGDETLSMDCFDCLFVPGKYCKCDDFTSQKLDGISCGGH